MPKIRITQVRSTIGRPWIQGRTIKALGLGKLHRTVEIEASPAVIGMVKQVSHLVKVEEA